MTFYTFEQNGIEGTRGRRGGVPGSAMESFERHEIAHFNDIRNDLAEAEELAEFFGEE